MKDFLAGFRKKPSLVYLVLFLLMIIPALGLYGTAESNQHIGLVILLVFVILANLAAVLL